MSTWAREKRDKKIEWTHTLVLKGDLYCVFKDTIYKFKDNGFFYRELGYILLYFEKIDYKNKNEINNIIQSKDFIIINMDKVEILNTNLMEGIKIEYNKPITKQYSKRLWHIVNEFFLLKTLKLIEPLRRRFENFFKDE